MLNNRNRFSAQTRGPTAVSRFKVLAVLLEKPGEVVGRDELRVRIWGENAFGDFDHGLSTAVNRLRAALRDSAETPRYVETLARRGYRFIGKVEDQLKPASSQAVATKSRSYEWWAWLAAGVAALAGVALWSTRERPLPPRALVPLPAYLVVGRTRTQAEGFPVRRSGSLVARREVDSRGGALRRARPDGAGEEALFAAPVEGQRSHGRSGAWVGSGG
jgi:hypothetical protein